jgi:RecB family exonuclease
MEMLLLEAPRRLFACTPSKLATFADCPSRYHRQYVRKGARPSRPWAHFSLGSSVHLALARWWDRPEDGRTPAAAAGLLEAAWLSDGYRDNAQEDATRALARGWVEGYVATLDPAAVPLAVERDVAAKSARLAFRGRVDRLDEDPDSGDLAVVDYKTGARPLAADEARGSAALALYAAAASRMFRRRCVRVELHHLPTGEVQVHEHDDVSLRRAVSRAESIADDVQDAEQAVADGVDVATAFPVRPGRACGWCDFRSECPEGQQAAPEPVASWSSLPLAVRG